MMKKSTMKDKINTNKNTAIIVRVLFITATVAGILCLPFTGIVNDPDYLIKLTENQNQVMNKWE